MASYDRYYDCKVEYLKSNGNQYLDIGIIPKSGYRAICVYMPEKQFTDPRAFFGQRTSYQASDAFSVFLTCGTSPQDYHVQYASDQGKVSVVNAPNILHTVELGKKSYLDGNLLKTVTTTFNGTYTISIFATHQKFQGSVNYNDRRMKDCRVYSFKLYNDSDTLIFDGIPVRRGTKGYMYDKVSGRLFGNLGTGNFIIGPDIPVADKLVINNIPLRELGCVLAPDSYKSALQWAKFKSIRSTDWAEYNYAEYDLEKPTLDKRTVTLNFHANGSDGYRWFMEYLMQYVYSYYYFPELGLTLRMRIDQNSLKSIDGKWQSFSINFIDDEPHPQQPLTVSFQDFPETGYALDGVDLATYGISILKGTLQTIVKKPNIKERLLINENSMDGTIYDGNAEYRYKPNTFTLKCLLRAEDLTSAVANYYYIYELLRQSGTRRIQAQSPALYLLGEEDGQEVWVRMPAENIDCWYNQCTVNAVHKRLSSGLAGIAFDISFNIVSRAVVTVLGTDDETTALTSDTSLLVGNKETII